MIPINKGDLNNQMMEELSTGNSRGIKRLREEKTALLPPSRKGKQVRELPDEMIGEIFSYLDAGKFKEWPAYLSVSKQWCHIIEQTNVLLQLERVARGIMRDPLSPYIEKTLSKRVDNSIITGGEIDSSIGELLFLRFPGRAGIITLDPKGNLLSIRHSHLLKGASPSCKKIALAFPEHLDLDQLNSSIQTGNTNLDKLLQSKDEILRFLKDSVLISDEKERMFILSQNLSPICEFINSFYDLSPVAAYHFFEKRMLIVDELLIRLLKVQTQRALDGKVATNDVGFIFSALFRVCNLHMFGDDPIRQSLKNLVKKYKLDRDQDFLFKIGDALYSVCFEWMADELWTNKEFILKLLKHYRIDSSHDALIERLSHFRGDPAIVLGLAKAGVIFPEGWIEPTLLQDRGMVLSIMRGSLNNLMFNLPEHFMEDKELILTILKSAGREETVDLMPDCVKGDKELFLTALPFYGLGGDDPFEGVSEEIMTSPGFLQQVIDKKPKMEELVPEQYQYLLEETETE